MHLQAVRNSEEAFKLQEDAQYGSSPFLPKDKVLSNLTLVNPLTKDASLSCTTHALYPLGIITVCSVVTQKLFGKLNCRSDWERVICWPEVDQDGCVDLLRTHDHAHCLPF